MPFGMKGLQKNLPKSKYENTSTKEESSTEKTNNDSYKYSPRSMNPIRLGRILGRTPSVEVIPEKYSPRNM